MCCTTCLDEVVSNVRRNAVLGELGELQVNVLLLSAIVLGARASHRTVFCVPNLNVSCFG